MINDNEQLLAEITAFLIDLAEEANSKNFVVGLSGGIDSAVTFAVAAHAAKERGTRAVGVMMPCHSSGQSQEYAQAVYDALKAQGLPVVLWTADLTPVYDVFMSTFGNEVASALEGAADQKYVNGSFRSCLRAPVLDFVSKWYNALIVGTGNRDEDEIFRYYQKRGDGAVDCNPISCLHKSEVWTFGTFLGIPEQVVKAVPTADLWEGQTDEEELGITYAQIEWVTREEDLYGVISDVNVIGVSFEDTIQNAEHLRGSQYTFEEVELIKRAIQVEKATLHKSVPPVNMNRDCLTQADIVS